MIDKENVVHPWIPPLKKSAFLRMRQEYEKLNREGAPIDFWDDFNDYSVTGFVYISPTSMWMAKPCVDQEGAYWFVRFAVGNIIEMLRFIPTYLPRIKWCRRNDGKLRWYYTDRLLQIVTAKEKRKRWAEEQSAVAHK